jgi:hypothetical protein
VWSFAKVGQPDVSMLATSTHGRAMAFEASGEFVRDENEIRIVEMLPILD